jgi:hypothetical protein
MPRVPALRSPETPAFTLSKMPLQRLPPRFVTSRSAGRDTRFAAVGPIRAIFAEQCSFGLRALTLLGQRATVAHDQWMPDDS